MPLEYAYSEIPLAQTLEKLVAEGKAPVYVVHFTQTDAADSAQDFTSLNLCTREEKDAVAARDRRLPLHQPVRPRRPQVAAARHRPAPRRAAAEVPRARRAARAARACSRSSAAPTPSAWASTCPSAPCSSRGCASSTARRRRILTARDFHQIAGRAGRKGFDDRGYVVAQAPEHVIENLRLEREGRERRQEGREAQAARAQLRELGPADLQAADRRAARAADLALRGVARDAAERARRPRRRLPRDAARSSATATSRTARRRRTSAAPGSCSARWSTRGIVEIVPRTEEGAQVRVNVELQDDFSMNQTLSLYLLETIPLLEPESPRLRPRPAHPGREHPREPRADPAPAARQAEGPRRSRR